MAVDIKPGEMNKQAIRKGEALINKLNKYLPSLKLRKTLLLQSIRIWALELEQCRSKLEGLLDEHKAELGVFNLAFGQMIMPKILAMPVNTEVIVVAGLKIDMFVSINAARYDTTTPGWNKEFEKVYLLSLGIVEHAKRIKSLEHVIQVLKDESRKVSIRVNLFEKHLIPKTQVKVLKIKHVLSDRFLGFIGQIRSVKNLTSNKGQRS